ncbi:GtrA family protein [Caenimonas aquaedulcis]|uniref:GtrA family protein n=1 Tax=Caenimonas aquaedulcis TaxID=2793270 RepID=A0A931MIF0_9BURK|nr:GtrA family protein [Caenimonas aquaedulcis]MBG9390061.1 GtrA family protein [Caenimonas aquaedulcis]
MKAMLRLASFVAVGCAAAAVHFCVVVLLVSRAGAMPLAANVGGWLVAFAVSFLGQWGLTFRSRAAPVWRSISRFFAVSLLGFLANESAYALLLHFSSMSYDVLLAAVLVGVALMTYLLSSRWAFRGNPAG